MKQTKYKQKVLRELAALLDSEEETLEKYARYYKTFLFIGLLFCAVSVLESFEPHWPLPLIAAIGIIGGLFVGLGIMFSISVAQWPIMKPFINAEAIKEARKDGKSL